MSTYFAKDGSYGDAEGMFVTDTSEWTEQDWSDIWSAGDYDRAVVASLIAKQY